MPRFALDAHSCGSMGSRRIPVRSLLGAQALSTIRRFALHRSTVLLSSAVLVAGLVAAHFLACGGDGATNPTTPANDGDASTRDAQPSADGPSAPPPGDDASASP